MMRNRCKNPREDTTLMAYAVAFNRIHALKFLIELEKCYTGII